MADAHRERDPSRREADIPAGAAPSALDGATGMAAQEDHRPMQVELWALPHSPSVRLEVVPTFPTPAYTVVTEPAALARLLPQLQAAPRLGVDTETTGLDPLTDRLRLLQLATADRVIVVDLASVPVPMLTALFAQEREWLVHNGLFDVRFVTAAGLRWSGRFFDTMLIAVFSGVRSLVGYGSWHHIRQNSAPGWWQQSSKGT
jgi:hypothetical protein